jgi:hypothetical protein
MQVARRSVMMFSLHPSRIAAASLCRARASRKAVLEPYSHQSSIRKLAALLKGQRKVR